MFGVRLRVSLRMRYRDFAGKIHPHPSNLSGNARNYRGEQL
jgi:hypothetical protein